MTAVVTAVVAAMVTAVAAVVRIRCVTAVPAVVVAPERPMAAGDGGEQKCGHDRNGKNFFRVHEMMYGW